MEKKQNSNQKWHWKFSWRRTRTIQSRVEPIWLTSRKFTAHRAWRYDWTKSPQQFAGEMLQQCSIALNVEFSIIMLCGCLYCSWKRL